MSEKLYFDEPIDFNPNQSDWEDVQVQMRKMDKQLRKLRKKESGGGKKSKKKLKKRLKALEREYEQLRQLLLYATCQGQLPSSSRQRVWWQDALTNSLPKAIELAAVSVNRLPSKK